MFTDYLDHFQNAVRNTKCSDQTKDIALDDTFDAVHKLLLSIRKNRNHLYLIGNGGSSGIVSHGAIDFLNACGFKAHALTDNSLLTCMANDYGYENVFAQPFKNLLEKDDMVIAISSSGKSANIINACKEACEKGSKVITFSGFHEDNPLRKLGDYNFWINNSNYGIVEIGHSLLLHHITDQLSIK